MSKTLERNISDYISYFRNQIQIIDDHCPDTIDGELHSRILYSALLDAISRPLLSTSANRLRIVHFVSKFCNWPECDRVSLSHLYGLVSKRPEPDLAPLRDFAIRSMSQWIRSEKIPLSRDPHFVDVAQLWPQTEDKMIDGVALEMLKHSNLLYTYRNSLIHEFRLPGRHVQLWDQEEPYYATLIEYEDESSRERRQTWELQYTAKFFRRLCSSGLSNLEEHLIANGIDPFQSIDWGNYWLRNMNP